MYQTSLQKAKELLNQLIDNMSSYAPRTYREELWLRIAKDCSDALSYVHPDETVPTKSAEVICEEAADIANFAMMIADNARQAAERLRGAK